MAAGGLNPTTTGKRYDNGGLPLGARRCSFFHLATFGARCQAKGAYRKACEGCRAAAMPSEVRKSGYGVSTFGEQKEDLVGQAVSPVLANPAIASPGPGTRPARIPPRPWWPHRHRHCAPAPRFLLANCRFGDTG